MLTSQFVINHYLQLIIAFLVVYLCGHIIISFFNRKPGYDSLFLKLTVGLLFLPTAYAVFRTNGNTVMLFNIALAAGLVAVHHKQLNFSLAAYGARIKKLETELLPLLVFLTVSYGLNLYVLFDFSDGGPRLMHPDYAFSSRLSGFLRDTGTENLYLESFLTPLPGNTPYHFMELWLTALVSKTFGMHVQYSLQLIVFSLLFTIIYAGFICLVQTILKSNNKRLISWVLPWFFFTVAMYAILYPDHIEILQQNLWTLTIINIPKLTTIYVFLIWTFLLIKSNRYLEASFVCGFAATSYTLVTPGLFLAFGALLIYRAWIKAISVKNMVIDYLPMISTAMFLLVFYIGESNAESNVILVGGESSLLEVFKLKTAVNIFGKTMLQILITASPFIILLFYLKNIMFRRDRDLTIFWVLLTIFSLLSWMIFNVSGDAVQLWANLYVPVSNLFSCYLLVILLDKKVRYESLKYVVVAVLLLSNLYLNFPLDRPNEKLEQVNVGGFPESKSPRFVYLKEQEDYEKSYQKNELVYVGQLYSLVRKYDPTFITCISNGEYYPDDPQRIKLNNSSTFPRYINEAKRQNRFVSIAESQKSFITEHKIDFLLMNKQRNLPDHFLSLFDPDSIGVVNGYSVYKRLKNK